MAIIHLSNNPNPIIVKEDKQEVYQKLCMEKGGILILTKLKKIYSSTFPPVDKDEIYKSRVIINYNHIVMIEDDEK